MSDLNEYGISDDEHDEMHRELQAEADQAGEDEVVRCGVCDRRILRAVSIDEELEMLRR